MAQEAAIVTLVLGEQHQNFWRQYCQPTWEAYARQHGFDVIVVDQPVDRSELAASRSPAWQKCLLPSESFASQYRQLVILDSDLVINAEKAPKITDQVPETSVGGVISGSQIHPDLRIHLLSRMQKEEFAYEPAAGHWREHQAAYYRRYGLTPIDAGIVQTGVLVASPHHHKKLFEAVYYAPCKADEHRTDEQVPLSHAILSSGLFRQIDTRFNSIFYETMLVFHYYLLNEDLPIRDVIAMCAVQAEFANNFFLHFAYDRDFVRFLHPKTRQPPQ
jgi:hypothetical protein